VRVLLRPFRIAPMMYSGVLYPPRPAPAASPQTPRPDVVEQLRGLKALQDDGVLTAEEFEVAKRKVLDR
jgi:hypothetical protein